MLEPFGEGRADLRMASQMALLANTNRNKKKKPTAYTAKDFMFDFESRFDTEEDKKQKMSDEMIQALGSIPGVKIKKGGEELK